VQVIHQEFRPIRPAEVVDALQIRPPVAGVLSEKTVNDVLAQEQIGQIGVGRAVQQPRRRQVRLGPPRIFNGGECDCHVKFPEIPSRRANNHGSSAGTNTWCLINIRTPLAQPSGPPAKFASC